MFIDTHTHLNDKELYDKRNEVVKSAIDANVKIIVNASDDFASMDKILKLTEEFKGVCYPVLGIHPSAVSEYDQKRLSKIILDNINTVLAIGEIGLDYHYENDEETIVRQKDVFISQIILARKYSLPIIIHSRDADQDTFDILKEHAQGLSIDIHCYGGSLELAKEYIKVFPNIRFGIGGVLTFPNSRRLVEVVKGVDKKHLILETDAPYITPAPYRGRRNEPKYIPLVAQKMAEILELDLKEVESFTTKNAKEFLRL